MGIKAAIATYGAALNANDIGIILDLYSAEPVFMPQGAPALVGRSAVRAGYEQVFSSIKLQVQFTIHEVEEVGDWAWVRTSSAGRVRVLANGLETDEGNNELFVFHREDGVWRIHRYLFATNLSKA